MEDDIAQLRDAGIDQLVVEVGAQGIVALLISSLMRNPDLEFSKDEAKAMIRTCVDSV